MCFLALEEKKKDLMSMMSGDEASRETSTHIHIEPSQGWVGLQLRELWRYRELMYFLTWRDIKVRYKQTLLGIAWAIIQPLMTMVVFSFIFGELAKIPSEGIAYPLFTFAGLVPWTFFANALTQSSNSLVNNANLIQKVYFPRLIIPISSVLAGVVDFFLAFVVLAGLMAFFGVLPSLAVLTLPLFLLLALITSLGVGLWLTALSVQFRDVRYVVGFLVQFWFFITPVTYSSTMLEGNWRLLYGINPMVGVVEGFRWALLKSGQPPDTLVYVSAGIALLIFTGGLFYFRRMEKTFSDVI
jgi:lipopolysaccharide transport system permease protein